MLILEISSYGNILQAKYGNILQAKYGNILQAKYVNISKSSCYYSFLYGSDMDEF